MIFIWREYYGYYLRHIFFYFCNWFLYGDNTTCIIYAIAIRFFFAKCTKYKKFPRYGTKNINEFYMAMLLRAPYHLRHSVDRTQGSMTSRNKLWRVIRACAVTQTSAEHSNSEEMLQFDWLGNSDPDHSTQRKIMHCIMCGTTWFFLFYQQPSWRKYRLLSLFATIFGCSDFDNISIR